MAEHEQSISIRRDVIEDLSKEIRTDLFTVLGLSQILQEEMVDSHFFDDLAQIQLATERVLALVSQMEAIADRAQRTAALDPLTEIPNRRTFEHVIADMQDERRPFTIILLDLNHFKQINDEFGHITGDDVLQQAAKRWSSVLRNGDLLCRYGGDEFMVMLPGADEAVAANVIERLKEALNTPIQTRAGSMTVGVSIGVAMSAHPDTSLQSLIERADKLMYDQKWGDK